MQGGTESVFWRLLRLLENFLLVAALTVMIAAAFGQIILRNFLHIGVDWADAFLRYLVLWVALLGAMAATREDRHITLDIVSHLFSPRGRAAARIVTDFFAVAVCITLAYASILFLLQERAGGAVAFASVPAWAAEIILPVAFVIIGLRYLRFFLLHLKQTIRPAAARSTEADAP